MSLKKKLSAGLALGLLALAFTALPAMAQAAPTLRSEGNVVAVGSKVVATSSSIVTETELGKLTCGNVTLDGTVLSNPTAALSGTGTASGCLANGEAPVEITSINFTDNFIAGGTDEGTVKFVYDIPAAGRSGCFLEGPIATTWVNGSQFVKISPSSLTGGGESGNCPAGGKISGELALETEAGVAVTVNNK